MKTAIELLSLLLVGWIAGAELGRDAACSRPWPGSYEQFVAAEEHAPHVRPHHAVLMPLSGILAVALIIGS